LYLYQFYLFGTCVSSADTSSSEDAKMVLKMQALFVTFVLKRLSIFFNTSLGFDAGMFLYHAASTILKFYNPSL